MDITLVLLIIGLLYGVLLFFDNFFKTCAHYPYIKFLEGTGFEIHLLWIKWKTKAFNRTLIKWGTKRPRFWNIWFTSGVYASFVLLPVSLLVLIYSIFQNFTSGTSSGNNIVIEPVIPGVNLPASEIGYYSLSLIVCSIVHELGHALAAVKEDVNLIDVGANMFFVLPVAFVNLSTDKFSSLSPKQTLKILCAGVWHNIILALVALAIYIFLPFLFSVCFHVNSGIFVSEISQNSPLLGPKGLHVGDVVFSVNDCKVLDESTWYDCLVKAKKEKLAFCIEADFILNLDESIPLKHLENGNLECCDANKPENICFEYLDKNDGILELPMHACLPARNVVEQSKHYCNSPPHICPENHYCFSPILENITQIFKLNSKHRNVIYLGPPSDIYRTIEVSSFIPKYFFTTPMVADRISKFLKYLIMFSSGLAIVNVIPFMYMDGQYITEIIGFMILQKTYGRSMTKGIMAIIIWLFTILLICHCLYFTSKVLL